MGSKDQQLYQDVVDTKLDLEQPEGWEFPKISDILTINYGKGLKKSDRRKGNVPVYGSNGVVGQHNSALTEGQTIIIGRKGSVGEVNFSSESCWPIDTTYFIDKFYGLVPQFLFHAMRSLNLGELDTSTAIPGLNRNDIYKQQIPLPPVPEQKRIVAKVEELLARVNVVRERLARAKDILKRFRQSVLSAACSGRLTAEWREKNLNIETTSELLKRIPKKKKIKKNISPKNQDNNILDKNLFDIPNSWSFCFFEHIAANEANSIKAGPFGSSLKKSVYVPYGYKIYGQEQVIRGDANYGNYFIDEEKFQELKTCEVKAGDILVSLVGTIGRVLIIPDKFHKGIINPRLVKISLFQEISREYIAKYLSSILAMNILIRSSHGGTMDILNLQLLKSLPIPLPPIQEQHEIVRRVDALFHLAGTIEKRVTTASQRIDSITQAILSKAFCGELVPTEAEMARHEGRSYEPASGLFSKIKSYQKDIKDNQIDC